MSVYVDKPIYPYGRMLMCHMTADTLKELHAMADRIGIQRKWFQSDHYDICKSKRALAVRFGAIECGGKTIVRVVRQLRSGGLGAAQSAAFKDAMQQLHPGIDV